MIFVRNKALRFVLIVFHLLAPSRLSSSLDTKHNPNNQTSNPLDEKIIIQKHDGSTTQISQISLPSHLNPRVAKSGCENRVDDFLKDKIVGLPGLRPDGSINTCNINTIQPSRISGPDQQLLSRKYSIKDVLEVKNVQTYLDIPCMVFLQKDSIESNYTGENLMTGPSKIVKSLGSNYGYQNQFTIQNSNDFDPRNAYFPNQISGPNFLPKDPCCINPNTSYLLEQHKRFKRMNTNPKSQTCNICEGKCLELCHVSRVQSVGAICKKCAIREYSLLKYLNTMQSPSSFHSPYCFKPKE